MALEMNFVSPTGQEFEKLYFRIDEYSCDKKENVRARIKGYISREFFLNDAAPIEGSEKVITLTGDYSDRALNMKKQIYEHVKKLEEFANAYDVYE